MGITRKGLLVSCGAAAGLFLASELHQPDGPNFEPDLEKLRATHQNVGAIVLRCGEPLEKVSFTLDDGETTVVGVFSSGDAKNGRLAEGFLAKANGDGSAEALPLSGSPVKLPDGVSAERRGQTGRVVIRMASRGGDTEFNVYCK